MSALARKNKQSVARRFSTLVIVLVLSLAMLAPVVSCTKAPLTGRTQLNLIPADEMLSMSFSQYDQFLKENKVSTDAAGTAQVQRVGKRIEGAVEKYFRDNGMSSRLNGYAWQFTLIESDQINAWCMPGGKVVVYTGILPICQNDAGLAVVLGHEIAHAVAEHGNERMSQALLAQAGGVALSAALRNKPEQTQKMWMTAFGVGAQVGVLLPFSRTQESEADHLGLIFMAMAGYDPHTAVSFWERMASSSSGGKPPEILSTHPSDATRIRQIEELMPEAMKYYKP